MGPCKAQTVGFMFPLLRLEQLLHCSDSRPKQTFRVYWLIDEVAEFVHYGGKEQGSKSSFTNYCQTQISHCGLS